LNRALSHDYRLNINLSERIMPLREEMIKMFPRITGVRHIETYRLMLTFSNGVEAELDFADRITGRGGVFAQLEDIDFFKRVRVDPEVGTLVWSNEVDFCPDVLYSEAVVVPLPELDTL
jgi:hypothetical protein